MGWLPVEPALAALLRAAEAAPDWPGLVALAGMRPDLLATTRLDRLLLRHFPEPPAESAGRPVRLALLGSATVQHLAAGVRVGALRRGLHVAVHVGEYGQYAQDLRGRDPALAAFAPDTVLLSLDARHLAAGVSPGLDAASVQAVLDARVEGLRRAWAAARALGAATVIQQTALPVLPVLLGGNEVLLAGSPAEFLRRLNHELRAAAMQEGVALFAVDAAAQQDGVATWHNPVAWHNAKQEISGRATMLYGDLAGRLLAALQGRSAKVLVLDLDNTLWGGVIGDDGLDGIVLGQGSALGEAFVAVQEYARQLTQRGVVLAVCSKNDEANAVAPFDSHPEMVLRRDDIACLVANWDDKASNLRRIAARLNLGLDSLVLLDDNPVERALIRRELPMVAVPEFDGDPAGVPQMLADAGYFEAVGVTEEDHARTAQYRQNSVRAALVEESGTDLPGYLRSLEMRLSWRRFDEAGLARIVQLVNKTNQFNLTTQRTTPGAIRSLIADPRRFGLQLRLADRFGDNGIVVIVTGALSEDGADCVITDWLMSCRVLGRQVEQATLGLVAGEARRLGATQLVGEYRPTAKNGIVRELYTTLGFAAADTPGRFTLALDAVPEPELFMRIEEGQ